MNSNTLDKTKDPGKDGTVYPSGLFAARNERVAKDLVGFSLGYYGGDYSPIGGNPAEAAYAGTAFGNGADDLFNGNIRHMVTAIEGLAIQGYAYRYDQLQRIKQMQVYRASDVQSLFAWTNSSATDEYKTTFTYDRNGNLTTLNRNGIGAELDMDRFVYNYHMIGGEPSNRLDYVTDNGTDYASYEDIKSGQTSGNYTYNKIGELVSDVSESMILHWRTGDHKLSKIERTDQDSPQIEFFYTAFGQRAMKVEKPRASGVIQPASQWKYTYYSYDANGQVMAVYSGNFQGSSEQVKLAEQHLYSAERLGMITRDVVVFDNGVTSYTHKEEDVLHEDIRGQKRFELHGHTNSVLAVISDRKMYNSVDGNYEPVLISWADYYAFGMFQSGRHGSATSELYRYLFQSMETDRGISGEGNSYTTEFRQYDPRLGRWKSLDPLMDIQPQLSPYQGFNSNPVYFTDPLGLIGGPAREKIELPTPENLDPSDFGIKQGGWSFRDAPNVVGTFAHTAFSTYMKTRPDRDQWRSEEYLPTETTAPFPKQKPDLLFVGNPRQGSVYELKPVGTSWDPIKKEKARQQVDRYLFFLRRNGGYLGRNWVKGNSDGSIAPVPTTGVEVPSPQGYVFIFFSHITDTPQEGLIYYQIRKGPQREPVKEPVEVPELDPIAPPVMFPLTTSPKPKPVPSPGYRLLQNLMRFIMRIPSMTPIPIFMDGPATPGYFERNNPNHG